MRKLALAVVIALLVGTATAQDQVKIGYLHTLAVDGIMWLAEMEGLYEAHGIDVEFVLFGSGPPLAQALSGGSVDIAIMGAVISNITSRGVGKVFLTNNIESGTAAIFVDPDSGIESVEDLVGAELATTQGTTAHVLLATAMQAADQDPNSVNIVNMDMPSAVSAFINGAVPALSTWWPFTTQVVNDRPDAVMLTQAEDYYPEAAIMGGWVANTRYYEQNRDTLVKLAQVWLEANEILMTDTATSLERLQAEQYPNLTLEDLTAGFEQLRSFNNDEWAERYRDGSVLTWIGQVEQVFVDIGALDSFVDPSEFVDTSIYLEAYEAQ